MGARNLPAEGPFRDPQRGPISKARNEIPQSDVYVVFN
jgi:hypothetical protein